MEHFWEIQNLFSENKSKLWAKLENNNVFRKQGKSFVPLSLSLSLSPRNWGTSLLKPISSDPSSSTATSKCHHRLQPLSATIDPYVQASLPHCQLMPKNQQTAKPRGEREGWVFSTGKKVNILQGGVEDGFFFRPSPQPWKGGREVFILYWFATLIKFSKIILSFKKTFDFFLFVKLYIFIVYDNFSL